MAFITVSNTLSNGQTIDAGELNTNYTDITNGLSDGTKDVTVAAINCTTLATTGAVTLGDASGDVITVNGTPAFQTKVELAGSDIASGSTPDADTLYPNSIIKAWAQITNGSLTEGFNCTVADNGTGDYSVTFKTNMADNNYAVVATVTTDAAHTTNPDRICKVGNLATTGFDIACYDITGAALVDTQLSFIVVGKQ